MINKNKRIFLIIGFIRWIFPFLEKIVPSIARKLGIKLFFTPFRFNPPQREKEVISESRKSNIYYNSLKLQIYEWGSGPAIILMHGWAGRASQFSSTVAPLVDNGFKVVAFDAPGHGASMGKESDLLEFAKCIALIAEHRGPFFAGVGHSLGGTAVLLARKQGLDVQKIITLAVPAEADGIITEFLKKINGTLKTGQSIKQHVLNKFGKPLDELSAYNITSKGFPQVDALIIHDENDTEAPLYHFNQLTSALPEAATMLTKGLGHNKILRSTQVVEVIIQFLKAKKIKENKEVAVQGISN